MGFTASACFKSDNTSQMHAGNDGPQISLRRLKQTWTFSLNVFLSLYMFLCVFYDVCVLYCALPEAVSKDRTLSHGASNSHSPRHMFIGEVASLSSSHS